MPGLGIIGRTFETGVPLFYEDIQTDPEYHRMAHRKTLLKAGFRGHFCMPIGVKGRTVGVINFVSKSAHQFLPNEVQLIQSFTNQIGVALENARLYEQTKEQEEELKRSRE